MQLISRVGLALLLVAGSTVACHAHETTYTAFLSGVFESPANTSPGIGFVTILLDFDLVVMDVDVSFSSLVGTVTEVNLHAATPTPQEGTAIAAIPFAGFPTGVASGTYTKTIDLTDRNSYNPAYITANSTHPPPFDVSDALSALDVAMDGERSYVSIRTTAFPGGEIRGFLVAVIPDPSTLGLLVFGGVWGVLRRRKTPST
jgi:CHRD domain